MNAAPSASTSQQIKTSAQARLVASQEAGRNARENIQAIGKTPDDESCQAAWDNLLDSEKKALRYGIWLYG